MKRLFAIFAILAATMIYHTVWAADADDVAYFQQFIYEENSDSTDPENIVVSSRFLMSDYMATTPMPNGDNLNVHMSILLFKDFKFAVVYKENLFPKGSTGGFMPGACKIIEGTWSVQNGQAVLPGIAVLDRALWQGQAATKLTVTDVVATAEAKGFQAVASFGFSNMTKDQILYCFPF